MSSLAHCLEKYGNLLTDYEKKLLQESAQVYRKEGFKAKIANASAVEDILRDLESERDDIVIQIKANVPDNVDVDAILGLKAEPQTEILKRPSIEVKEVEEPTQTTLITEEAPFELKGEEPPPKVLGPQHKKAVFPTEKIMGGTAGEQTSILPPKTGEQVSVLEGIEEAKKPPETKLAMAGEKAIGAPTGALAKAQEMLAKGDSEDAVWKETGWLKGVEGKWKFEIDDSGAEFTKQAKEYFDTGSSVDFSDNIKLKDVLSHDALFKAYPQLKDMPVSMKILWEMDKLVGRYKPGGDYSSRGIRVAAKSIEEAKSILFHEIQHGIQEIEGFARGGSVGRLFKEKTGYLPEVIEGRDLETYIKAMEDYPRLAGEIESREVAERKDLTPAQRGLNFKEAQSLWNQAEELKKSDAFKKEETVWEESDLSEEGLKVRNESPAHKEYYALQSQISDLGYDLTNRLVIDALKGSKPAQDLLIRPPYADQTIPRSDWIVKKDVGENFSLYKEDKYQYLIDCVGCDNVEALTEMIDEARDIGYDTFISHVDVKELAGMFDFYDWGPGNKGGLRLKDDYAVSYHKSHYEGKPVYYIRHSAIEYIFSKQWSIQESSGTSFSVEPAISAEPQGYKFTKKQIKDIIRLAPRITEWLKKAGADKEILDRITVDLKPFISMSSLSDKYVAQTISDWETKGVTVGRILGSTSFESYHALIQLAYNSQNLKKMETTAYHEYFHIAKRWLLPKADIEQLGKEFKTEEDQADAFADFIDRSTPFTGRPGIIRRIFLKLRRMLTIIRNGLRGRGFHRPEDIFGKIKVGAYKMKGDRAPPGVKIKTLFAMEGEKPPTKMGEGVLDELVGEAAPKQKVLPTQAFTRRGLPALPGLPSPISPIRRSRIIKDISKKLEVPIKIGKFRGKKKGGIYKPREQVIRARHANDVEVVIHEVAHHIESLLELPKTMPKEVRLLAYKDAKSLSREGFAEFLRHYVTNETKARTEAPTFYTQFEDALKENKDVQDVLVKARMAWEEWVATPNIQKLTSFIVDGSDVKKKRVTLNEIYTNWKDGLRAFQIVTEEAKKKGMAIRTSEDPYILGRLTKGWARKGEQYLKYGTFQLTESGGAELTGPSLREILQPIEQKGQRRILDAYLWAKRGTVQEKAIKGFLDIGLSEEIFSGSIEEIEEAYPEIVKAAEQIHEYSRQLKQYLKDSGRISKEFADVLDKVDAFYAPLYKMVDDMDPGIKGMSKDKFGNLYNPIRKLGVSSRNIISPTESLIFNTFAMINVAERNRVGAALINIAEKAEGMGATIEKIPFRVKPIKMSIEEAVKGISKTLGAEETDVIKQLEALGLDKASLDTTIATFRPNIKAGPNEVIFYKNGNPYLVEVDPLLYKSIMALDQQSLGTYEQLLAYPAQWLRAGAVMYNPEFGIRNPFKDQLTAWAQTKYGYVPFLDLARGLAHILGVTETWQFYNASGGAHAALVSMDRDYLSQTIKALLRKKGFADFIKHPLETLQIFSELTEEATRVGEFAKALKKEGRTLDGLLKSGFASREVTLDFSRIGAKARAVNAISAFWNAGVEGVDKFVRVHKDNPLRASMIGILGFTIPSILLWWAQKDDPDYQELPKWRRIACWNIVTHNKDGSVKHIWSIPKPWIWGLIYGSMPEMMLDSIYKKDPEGMKEFAKQFLRMISPLPIPTGLIPPAEWWANKSFFFDSPTVPPGKEDLEPILQTKPYTSETVKLIAEGMNKVPGLKELASPAKIEQLIYGYSAGLGKLTLEQTDRILKLLHVVDVAPEPSMTLSDLPLIRGFVARYPSASSRSIEEFYDKYAIRKREWESKKERAGTRGIGWTKEGRAIQRLVTKEFKPLDLQQDEKTAEALSTLRKIVQTVYENREVSSEDKRIAIDNLYYVMINVARGSVGKKPIPVPKIKTNGRLLDYKR